MSLRVAVVWGLERGCTEAMGGGKVQECVECGKGAFDGNRDESQAGRISHSRGAEAGVMEALPSGRLTLASA